MCYCLRGFNIYICFIRDQPWRPPDRAITSPPPIVWWDVGMLWYTITEIGVFRRHHNMRLLICTCILHVAVSLALLKDETANSVLNQLLREDPSRIVHLQGFVSKRRALGASLVFLDIVPCELPTCSEMDTRNTIHTDSVTTPVQALLRRDFWGDEGTFAVYHKILQPGTHVLLMGTAGPSRIPDVPMLFATSGWLRLPNANPQHVRVILQYVREGRLPWSDVEDALRGLTIDQIRSNPAEKQPLLLSCGALANEFLQKFPRNFWLNPSHEMGASNVHKIALLPPVPSEFVTPPAIADGNVSDEGNIESISSLLKKTRQQIGPDASKELAMISAVGWVQNRRRFQNTTTVLEIVDNFTPLGISDTDDKDNMMTSSGMRNERIQELWKERIYATLHPSLAFHGVDGETTALELTEIYGNILCSGARVMLQGYLDTSASQKSSAEVAIFWVTRCRLLRSSWRPRVIRNILDCLHQGKFSLEEATTALKLEGGYSQAEEIFRGNTDATERQWLAAEISRSLQGESSRTARITPGMLQSLETFANARREYPIQKVNNVNNSTHISAKLRASHILQSNGTSLRKSPQGSRWQRAKRPQLEWMMEQIEQVLKSHPEYEKRRLNIVDIGGGKGLLSNLLAETFGENTVQVQVVDISRAAIKNGMMRAMRRGLENIQYDAQDATTLDLSGVDVVVALHACGALTDVALGHAVNHGAGFVICPCCFQSNPHLRIPCSRGDTRNTELVPVEEWLSVNETEYARLKQLAELQGDIDLASQAMHTICGLRAAAVSRSWGRTHYPVSITINSFPLGFSTRNLCLVGRFQK